MTTRTTLLALATVLLVAAGWRLADPFSFARGSSITIEGTSNVHDWRCTVPNVTGTMDATPNATGWSGLSALTVTVPVNSIDCRNGTMNTNLRNAFNASANPTIRFTLSNARVAAPSGGRFTVQANGTLAMAGQSRPITVTAQGVRNANGSIRFTGSVPVTMSQWGMTPPRAMAGTMRTGDRVTVSFDVTTGN